ncbi:MAG: hypothetical protein K2X87_35265 [Gemmataceae bacterium]|nr:hypothetical protein [Gemmataceae bacterium]
MTPDYQAALTGAAVFDRANAGRVVVTGPDAAMFLGNLCTNDIKSLADGQGCEAYFCNPTAKVQFQTWILRAGDYWIETTPGRGEELYQYLDRYLISERVEIVDRTAEFCEFHVAGPKAAEVAGRSGRPTANPLGVPGFDIWHHFEAAGTERDRLLAAGAVMGTPETWETLRIEAGTPVWGPDIDASRFVMEVGNAARAVSYTKGCYLGQEPIVMARDRAGHVNRLFTGLKVLDGGPPPAGTRLLRDGAEVGIVTSSCQSPRLGMPVALGYVRWKHHEPGTRLDAGGQPVEVIGLPPVK